MQVSAHLGTVDDVLGKVGEPARSILLALRQVIAARDPQACEVPSPRERLIWWGMGPRKMSDGYIYGVGFAHHANLGFFQGHMLPDPEGLLGGPGRQMRHLRLTDPAALEQPAVLALIEAAIAARRRPSPR